ncbi:MAG: class I SAM-dependent methyltransferase [Chloroflexota bacterium]
MSTLPAMYDELAGWFHLLTAPSDYAEEAAHILAIWREQIDGGLAEALELGSGGGNTASHLSRSVRMTLTDLSPAMLDVSRTINPDSDHVTGDMRTLRLGRTFDAVLIHDAIMYLTTEADLRSALETAFVHLRSGGVAVFAPDCVRETFEPSTDHGGHDEAEVNAPGIHAGTGGPGRGLRYLEWSTDPDPSDSTTQTDFAIVLREADGSIRIVHDRHVEGLFPQATWLRLLDESGFDADVEIDPWGREVFIARRPAVR